MANGPAGLAVALAICAGGCSNDVELGVAGSSTGAGDGGAGAVGGQGTAVSSVGASTGGSGGGGAGDGPACPGDGMGGSPPNAIWSQRIGGPGSAAIGARVVPNGTLLVHGRFEQTIDIGGIQLTSEGKSDLFLARYGADGTVLGANAFGGSQLSSSWAVGVDLAGNAIVAGVCYGGSIDLGDGSQSCGDTTMFLASFAPDGALLWRQGPAADVPMIMALATTADGDILVSGWCTGACTLGGVAIPGTDETFLGKLHADGTHVWSKRFPADAGSQVADLAAAPGGDVFLVGWLVPSTTGGGVDFGGGPLVAQGDTNGTANDAFVAAFDASGAHLWSNAIGDEGYSEAVAVVALPDGGAAVGGAAGPQLRFDRPDEQRAWVTRYDAAGQEVWTRASSGAGASQLADLAVTPAGVIHAGGRFTKDMSFGGGPLVASGELDAFVASFDGSGQVLGSRRFGDACDQVGTWLDVLPGGELVITGSLLGPTSSADLGNGWLATAGEDNAFIAVLPP